jgi:hypothetical protein
MGFKPLRWFCCRLGLTTRQRPCVASSTPTVQFIGVTGPSQVRAGLVDDLGVTYQPITWQASDTPGDQGHAGSVWLIGPDAVIRAELLPPFDVLLVTAEYLKTRLRG